MDEGCQTRTRTGLYYYVYVGKIGASGAERLQCKTSPWVRIRFPSNQGHHPCVLHVKYTDPGDTMLLYHETGVSNFGRTFQEAHGSCIPPLLTALLRPRHPGLVPADRFVTIKSRSCGATQKLTALPESTCCQNGVVLSSPGFPIGWSTPHSPGNNEDSTPSRCHCHLV